MFSVFIQGFLLQASLILALGAQNIFVLNSGLRRQHHILVASVSTLCDAILIFVGVLGVATAFIQIPVLKIGLGLLGVGFLFIYGLLKLKEAYSGLNLAVEEKPTVNAKKAIITTLGFSLLNPHVYLDTIVLVGGYSSKFPILNDRFYFGAGASVFSLIWFFGIVLSASWGSHLLKNPKAMRVISTLSGIVLIILSIKLGNDVLKWLQ